MYIFNSEPPDINPSPGPSKVREKNTARYTGDDFGCTFSSMYAGPRVYSGVVPAPMSNWAMKKMRI